MHPMILRRLGIGILFSVVLSYAAEIVDAQRRGPVSRRRHNRRADSIRAGDLAPDFTLYRLNGEETVTLSHYRGKKPVALVFGSYT